MYDNHEHSPCEHFARAGREYILANLTDDDLERQPPDHICDDDPLALARWESQCLLYHLRGTMKAAGRRRRKKAAGDKERIVEIAGARIDWHIALPELRCWSGQASLLTLVEGRQQAIWEADAPSEDVLGWRLPYKTMSGLDPRTAARAIDIGFSPARLGMMIETFAAAEVAAVLGMQIVPIARFGACEYGYQSPRELGIPSDWWTFRVVERERHHRMYTMSRRREWNDD